MMQTVAATGKVSGLSESTPKSQERVVFGLSGLRDNIVMPMQPSVFAHSLYSGYRLSVFSLETLEAQDTAKS